MWYIAEKLVEWNALDFIDPLTGIFNRQKIFFNLSFMNFLTVTFVSSKATS